MATEEELAQKEAELAQKEADLLKKEKEILEAKIGDPKIDELVQAKVGEALSDIKGKLDKAYGSRDEALKKVAEFEQKEREAEIQRLKASGKEKEAYELQLAEEKAKREALEKQNVELTRNIQVQNALNDVSKTFKSSKAKQLAAAEITGELVKNEQGLWMHKSGVTIEAYTELFCENADNAFLFKTVASSGGGTTTTTSTKTDTTKKSLFSMTQEEVLKMAAEGKLNK